MAIYHFSMQPISRGAGRSSTAAAAYRSGTLVIDHRTGEVFDYTRKQNVVSSDLFMPAGCPGATTQDFWNAVEKKHTKQKAIVAREIEASLPHELSGSEQKRLAHDFAKELADHYGVGVEADIHKPGREGDIRNGHCHFLMSACAVTPTGLGKKVEALDPIHCQRNELPKPTDYWRKRWADLTNERLAENGIDVRIDHRSLKDQGIDRTPEPHFGPAAVGYERRTGEESDIRVREREKAAALAAEKAEEEKQRQMADLSRRLNAAVVQLTIDHKMAEGDLQRAETVAAIEARAAAKKSAAPAAPATELDPAPPPTDTDTDTEGGGKPP